MLGPYFRTMLNFNHHFHIMYCRTLKLDYLDLYLIHWPVSSKHGKYKFPIEEDDFLPMDYEAVWSEMEECQRLGVAKCIRVSNFSCKKLQHILSIAKIPLSVNQVNLLSLLFNLSISSTFFCYNKLDM